MAQRKIIRIDEEKCDGCGQCVPACAEGALQIIDGKARLVSDVYCDGLGDCLGECPRGAISIEEREAEAFDEEAALAHVEAAAKEKMEHPDPAVAVSLPCGCPSAMAQMLKHAPARRPTEEGPISAESTLGNWPVQFRLIPANAPYLDGADLLIAADCVGFAYPALHQELLPGKVAIIGCPKLGDADALKKKLTEVFSHNKINSITIAHMEVPCCYGLLSIVQQALAAAGREIPVETIEIGIHGEKKSA
jgi:NAD-dependent dihydropyrimidine dehydrogenase PreA subunit